MYKEWYYEDKEITFSKTKEKYRLKLKEKEEMLKQQGLKYFILFPCDLTNENFSEIINNPSLNLKHEIERFCHHNIDWTRVRKSGKLDYSNKTIIKNTRAWKEAV